jgi:hypothetical protein
MTNDEDILARRFIKTKERRSLDRRLGKRRLEIAVLCLSATNA